ncbi:chemotaxis protein CheA [Niveispirillum sp. KHB5.9]|uniref:chemotaxis protein CheA n=1 Tax=Niveispirillum sp. KHB5.9 TaxID=3400269 RepID=UPI003A85FB79
MNSLLDQFMIEGRALVEEASDALLSLGQGGDDKTAVAAIFRAFHTLKGSSGLFDARAMTRVLHEAEELLAQLDARAVTADPALVNLLLACLDQVGAWLDLLERDGTLPASADATADGLVRQIGGRQGVETDAIPALADLDGLLDLMDGDQRLAALALHRDKPGSMIHLVSYTPLPGCFFNGDDPLALLRDLPGLAGLHVGLGEVGPLDGFDPFTCALSFTALVVGDDPRQGAFRLAGDQMRVAVLTPSVLEPKGAVAAATLLAEQVAMLGIGGVPAAEMAGRIAAAATVAANVLLYQGREDEAGKVAAAGRAAAAARDPAPLLYALTHPGTAVEPTPALSASMPGQSRLLRVAEDRIDRLVRLSGQLGLVKNRLGWLARERGEDRELHQLGSSLERLTRELEAAVLHISMMPVGDVFQRFPRLVHDLSARLGKPARLVLEGTRTEAEKAVVELLSEPLLHLVRNALDHGVEGTAARVAAGKPETATITLRALQQSGRLLIEVADDGRGIDTQAVRHRAVTRGLLGEADAASLSEGDALLLIFAPGLSTAPSLSEVSGRGVGMDAVRASVEKAGGGVAVRSVPGQGTTVTLSLPLSLSSLRLLTVEVSEQQLGVPMDMVAESIRLPRDRISRMRDRDMFSWRDRIVPLVSLAELLDLPIPPAGPDARVLLMEIDGNMVGVEVDGVGQRMDAVLRPMDGMLAGLSCYLGTVLLGDGTVMLVLDLRGIVR